MNLNIHEKKKDSHVFNFNFSKYYRKIVARISNLKAKIKSIEKTKHRHTQNKSHRTYYLVR